MKYEFATSKAGHDKGKVYIIIEETSRFLLLTDGNLHPIERPKKKNVKHIQPIHKVAISGNDITNEAVKLSIKQYLKES